MDLCPLSGWYDRNLIQRQFTLACLAPSFAGLPHVYSRHGCYFRTFSNNMDTRVVAQVNVKVKALGCDADMLTLARSTLIL
jgi:hypothetical protein